MSLSIRATRGCTDGDITKYSEIDHRSQSVDLHESKWLVHNEVSLYRHRTYVCISDSSKSLFYVFHTHVPRQIVLCEQ